MKVHAYQWLKNNQVPVLQILIYTTELVVAAVKSGVAEKLAIEIIACFAIFFGQPNKKEWLNANGGWVRVSSKYC